MNENAKLMALVQNIMRDIIFSYKLLIFELSESEVVLKADAYVIDIFIDRDGVNMLYFDTSRRPVKGYNLFLFLLDKRRDRLVFSPSQPNVTKQEQFVENMLIALVQHLRSAGRDILGGGKEWISAYNWPALNPSKELETLLNSFS